MTEHAHSTLAELEAGLAGMAASPKDAGELLLIVRRPAPGRRETAASAELTPEEGLAGDCWKARGSSRTPDRSPDPGSQLTLMNARVITLLAGPRERWQLAGDQLYVDLDLGEENLPPGTRLSLGSAVIEITANPHTGCKKFADWFGPDAVRFVNSPARRALRLRGVNARVVRKGVITTGDRARKLA